MATKSEEEFHLKKEEPVKSAEDREIYFMALKMLEDPTKEVPKESLIDPSLGPVKFGEVDESNYNCQAWGPVDFWARCVTFGYKTEKNRKEKSKEEYKKIIEGRKSYQLATLPSVEAGMASTEAPMDGINPPPFVADEKGNVPKSVAEYVQGDGNITYDEFRENWPIDTLNCMGPDGIVPVYYDACGNLPPAFVKKINSNLEKNLEACRRYCIVNVESLTSRKLALSREHGYRITKHYTVIDCAQVGVTTLGKVKPIVQAVLGDLSDLYPETVKQIYLVNTSWLFKAAWAIISLFVHPLTAQKIQMKGSSWRESLSKRGFSSPPSNWK